MFVHLVRRYYISNLAKVLQEVWLLCTFPHFLIIFAKLKVRDQARGCFMKNLILHPTDISQWYALVTEAEVASQLNLTENTESYLVFLLQRFSQAPQLTDSVVALDFLNAMQAPSRQKIEELIVVGDKSLLVSGLFPGLAERRHVSLDYYSDMGQAAYLTASELQEHASAELYLQLSQDFAHLQKILQAIRGEFFQFDHENHEATWCESDDHTH